MLVYFALHRERSHLAIVGLLVAAALGAQAFIAFAIRSLPLVRPTSTRLPALSPNLDSPIALGDRFVVEHPFGVAYFLALPQLMGFDGLLPSRLLGSIALLPVLVLAYATARLIAGRLAGLTALSLLALNPFVLASAHRVSSEIYLAAVVMAGSYLFARYVCLGGKWALLGAGSALGMALLVSYQAVPLIVVAAVWVLVTARGPGARARLGALSAAAIIWALWPAGATLAVGWSVFWEAVVEPFTTATAAFDGTRSLSAWGYLRIIASTWGFLTFIAVIGGAAEAVRGSLNGRLTRRASGAAVLALAIAASVLLGWLFAVGERDVDGSVTPLVLLAVVAGVGLGPLLRDLARRATSARFLPHSAPD